MKNESTYSMMNNKINHLAQLTFHVVVTLCLMWFFNPQWSIILTRNQPFMIVSQEHVLEVTKAVGCILLVIYVNVMAASSTNTIES